MPFSEFPVSVLPVYSSRAVSLASSNSEFRKVLIYLLERMFLAYDTRIFDLTMQFRSAGESAL